VNLIAEKLPFSRQFKPCPIQPTADFPSTCQTPIEWNLPADRRYGKTNSRGRILKDC
jgi:hypothetical protein